MFRKSSIQARIKKITNTGKVNKVLQYLSDEKKLGWEKWLQYELAFALNDLGDPKTEVKFSYDKRMKISSGRAKFENGLIDIVFRKKFAAKDYFTALELKLGPSTKIVRALVSDLVKIGASRSRKWDFRAVMAVGIFRDTGANGNKFSRGVQELVKGKIIHLVPIKKTQFKMLILGWQVAPRDALRSNYREWLKKVEDTLDSHDVRVRKKKIGPST